MAVSVNLSRGDARRQVEFHTTDGPLWTQAQVIDHCRKRVLQPTLWTALPRIDPLPVMRMPPMFPNIKTAPSVRVLAVMYLPSVPSLLL